MRTLADRIIWDSAVSITPWRRYGILRDVPLYMGEEEEEVGVRRRGEGTNRP